MSVISEPQTQRRNLWGSYDEHHFFCHGLFFTMLTGPDLPHHTLAHLTRGPEPFVLVKDQVHFVDIMAKAHRGTIARGALAKVPVENS